MILTAPNILIPRQHIWTPRRKGKLAALMAMANIFRWQGLDRSGHSCATCGCTTPCKGPNCPGCGSSCGPAKTQITITGIADNRCILAGGHCTAWNATWLVQSLTACTQTTFGPAYCGVTITQSKVSLSIASDGTLQVYIGNISGSEGAIFKTTLSAGTDCNALNMSVPLFSFPTGTTTCDWSGGTCHILSVP